MLSRISASGVGRTVSVTRVGSGASDRGTTRGSFLWERTRRGLQQVVYDSPTPSRGVTAAKRTVRSGRRATQRVAGVLAVDPSVLGGEPAGVEEPHPHRGVGDGGGPSGAQRAVHQVEADPAQVGQRRAPEVLLEGVLERSRGH